VIDGWGSMAASLTDRWSIPESEVIDWREWGDEFVVHVAGRGETHLLSPAAGSVLLALLGDHSGLTLEDLYAKTCGIGGPESGSAPSMTEEERDAMRAIVADFERLGMASRRSA